MRDLLLFRECHGATGSGAPHRSSPARLSSAEVERLPLGTKVVITWSGGNGPHRYEVCSEDEMINNQGFLARDDGDPCVTVNQVLREAEYVSMAYLSDAGPIRRGGVDDKD